MKKQLELKHLAPFLPYALKALQLNHKKNGNGSEFGVLTGFYPLYENKKPIWHYTFDNNAIGQTSDAIKPLLRPMSDLFENIVHNGEIVCVAELIRNSAPDENQLWGINKKQQTLTNITRERFWKPVQEPLGLPYWAIKILFKYHFDPFGLLDEDLAERIKAQENG